MNLIIKALSPEIIDDYLSFFDNMLFSENPDWSKCYCYSYHFTGADDEWTKERNRAKVQELIKNDEMRGFLAYDGAKSVAWCNANDKNNYQSFTEAGKYQSNLCSIVCFVVSPNYRRKGIAQKILEYACDYYALKGYQYIEAYPRKDKHSCERNYHGHFSLYEKLNFQIEKEFDDHYVVRKKL